MLAEPTFVVPATVEEAVEAARCGFAAVPLAALGADGEQRLNEQGVSVRCLQRLDGSLPAADGAEPAEELLAVVARAY